MGTQQQTRLQAEVDGLNKTVREAAKNPFLPAAARDAIVQAGFVVATLASELELMRAELRKHGLEV